MGDAPVRPDDNDRVTGDFEQSSAAGVGAFRTYRAPTQPHRCGQHREHTGRQQGVRRRPSKAQGHSHHCDRQAAEQKPFRQSNRPIHQFTVRVPALTPERLF